MDVITLAAAKKYAKQIGGTGITNIAEKSRDPVTGVVVYTVTYLNAGGGTDTADISFHDGKDAENSTPYVVGTGGVNAYQVVFISSANTIMAGNSANITHAGKIVGIATASGLAGASVAVQQLGQVVNPSWNLSAGSIYYLDAGGNITAVPPILGFVQKIGIAQNATTLFLQIESPIILN